MKLDIKYRTIGVKGSNEEFLESIKKTAPNLDVEIERFGNGFYI